MNTTNNLLTLTTSDGTNIKSPFDNIITSTTYPVDNNWHDKYMQMIGGTNMLNEKDTGNRWSFHVLHEDLISFDEIAMELDGANPMALVNYGETYKYVVISEWLEIKAADTEIGMKEIPKVLDTLQGDGYIVYKIEGNFSEWVDWAKRVKRASWTPTTRKHNVAKVSLPKL